MNKKGISVVSLSVTIVVLLVIVSSISISITYSISNAKKLTFAKEIYNIQSIVREYIQKENVLPVTEEAIKIKPSDLEQFGGEDFIDENVFLNIIDLTELDIKNTNYGNKQIGGTNEEKAKDVYAVSQTSGKVYYIAGFKHEDKTYYTLTEDLLNMIEKKQQLVIGEQTILFIPSKIGWSSEGVSIKIVVPNDYEVTKILIDNANIPYTQETNEDTISYVVNKDKIAENFSITIDYTKNGEAGNVKYSTKIDNTAPIISKDASIVNTSEYIKGLNATDEDSGIKYFKYVEGIINDSNVKTYMKSSGKDIKKGIINMKNKTVYTLYAEDKAGNYTVLHLDGEGERFYPKVANITGNDTLTLTNCYNLPIVNFKIYGNSIQNGTPTPETPIEVKSVGDKAMNLFDESLLLQADGNNVNNKMVKTDKGYQATVYPYNYYSNSDMVLHLKKVLKPNVTYTLSRYVTGYKGDSSGVIAIRNSSGALAQTPYGNGLKSVTFTFTQEQIDSISNVYIYGHTGGQLYYEYIQLEEGELATDYDPYGNHGYKIPIKVTGKNLFNYKEPLKKYTDVTEVVYEGRNCISWRNMSGAEQIKFIEGKFKPNTFYYFSGDIACNMDSPGYLRIKYTDGTYDLIYLEKYLTEVGKFSRVAQVIGNVNKTIESITGCWNSAERFYMDVDSIQVEEGTKATEYEKYKETITDIYLDEPLRKIGDYVDYIDFANQKVVRNVGEYIFTGKEVDYGGVNTTDNVFGMTSLINNSQQRGENARIGLCNYLPYSNLSFLDETSRFAFYDIKNHPYIYLFFEKKYFPDYEEYTHNTVKSILKDWHDKNVPMKLYYQLYKPVEEKINIPDIKLNYGTNYISIDTQIKPYQTDMIYYKKQ